MAEIERTRIQGYATNVAAWWRPDVSAIVAAIVGRIGTPVAATAISIPSNRFDPERVGEWGQAAIEAAAKISAALNSPA